MPYKFLNLQLFAEDGGTDMAVSGDIASPESTENPTANVSEPAVGEQTVTAQEPGIQEETFESLISGKFKKEYEDSIKGAIQKRFKNQRDLQGRIDKINPVVQMMAQRYGVQPEKDGSISIDALQKAIDNDNSMYEQEAFQRGISVEDLKQIKMLERENAALRTQNARTEQQKKWDELVAQGDDLKQTYPDFDIDTEMQNPYFGRMVATFQQSGLPNAVRTAYEAVHRDEIIGGSMKYAVQHTEEKISKSIQSGMRRPAENGTAPKSPGSVGNVDPSKLTKAQIDDIKLRAGRGERITF